MCFASCRAGLFIFLKPLSDKIAEIAEEACSQSSQLGEGELQKLEGSLYQKIRENKYRGGIGKFEKWCQRRRIVCDLAVIGATDLSGILRRFYAELKTIKDKKDLTASALTGIRAAIHRTITYQPISRPINILKDPEFFASEHNARSRLQVVLQERKSQAEAQKPYRKRRYAKTEVLFLM